MRTPEARGAAAGGALLAVLFACAADSPRAGDAGLRVEEAPRSAVESPGPAFELTRARPGGRASAADSLPELPRFTMDTREAATPSRGRRLHASGAAALHAALRAARGGDVILLGAGKTYVGNFVLPRRASDGGSKWITIRTEGDGVPAEGTRPSGAGGLARLETPNADPALATEAGAHHYRVIGVEVGAGAKVRQLSSLVALGSTGREQSRASDAPHHLVLDRLFVHGTPSLDVRRCVALNSAWTAVVDSWLADCHSNLGDSQAIWGSNGPGPFAIVGNRLEGAGENIMLGGDDSRAAELLPSDVTIARNYIVKPGAWQKVWSAKNLLELKVGRRVLIEGNVLEGSWVDAQIGFAVVFKSVNQSGGAPWSVTEDVTMRYNRLRRSAAGVNVSGKPEANPVAAPARRVLIEHNVIEPVGDPALGGTGRLFQVGEGARDVVVRHNTGFGANAAVIFSSGVGPGFAFTDNIVNGGQYRWSLSSAEGKGVGADALRAHAPGGRVSGNVFIAAAAQPQIPGNAYVGDVAEVGFADFARHDYRLGAASRFARAASDGTAPGADAARVEGATKGVLTVVGGS